MGFFCGVFFVFPPALSSSSIFVVFQTSSEVHACGCTCNTSLEDWWALVSSRNCQWRNDVPTSAMACMQVRVPGLNALGLVLPRPGGLAWA